MSPQLLPFDVSTLLESLLSPAFLWTFSIGSAVMLVVSMVISPLLVITIPADYFKRDKPAFWQRLKSCSPWYALVIIAKNLVGIVCLAAGILMLFLPGQGVLTILVGIFLLDVRGKTKLERRLISSPKVLQSINWLRRKYGRPNLEL